MSNLRLSLRLAGAALATGLLIPAARAQVVLSEVNFTTNAQWIEIHNAGTSDVDLTGWSLYQATNSTPGNYWYPMPAQTILQSGAYLRVHWLAPLQANTPTDIYTGQSIYHFLFGLSAETLDPTRGALALFNTQSNALMNTPAAMVDWVNWGTTGFVREGIAVSAGLWTDGSFAPAVTGANPLPTLANDYRAVGGRASSLNWFLDTTPTPGQDNIGNATVTSIGSPCSQTQRPGFEARLVSFGVPASGNLGFKIGIDRDLNAGEIAVQLLTVGADPSGSILPPIFDCPIYGDLSSLFFNNVIVPDAAGRAEVNYGQFNLTGVQFVSTWAVIDANRGWLTMTNALQMTFPN
jgi:hypothetical protein